jgi:hypothetical protein
MYGHLHDKSNQKTLSKKELARLAWECAFSAAVSRLE